MFAGLILIVVHTAATAMSPCSSGSARKFTGFFMHSAPVFTRISDPLSTVVVAAICFILASLRDGRLIWVCQDTDYIRVVAAGSWRLMTC